MHDVQWMEKLLSELESWLKDCSALVIIGVGNPLRRDDNIGIEIIRRLRGKTPDWVYLIESETMPENFIQEILDIKPTHVLIVDAALMDSPPGDSKLIDPTRISGSAISTHSLPLHLFSYFLTESLNVKVALLAIQPKDTNFGEGLTEDLERAAEEISNYIIRAVNSK